MQKTVAGLPWTAAVTVAIDVDFQAGQTEAFDQGMRRGTGPHADIQDITGGEVPCFDGNAGPWTKAGIKCGGVVMCHGSAFQAGRDELLQYLNRHLMFHWFESL